MKKFHLIAFLFLLLSWNNSYSQNKSKAGLYFDYGIERIDADFRALPGVPSCCPKFTSGNGNSYSIGGDIKFALNNFLGIGTRVNYYFHSGEFVRYEPIVLSVDNKPYNGQFKHNLETDYSTLFLYPYLDLKIFRKLYFKSGMVFHFIQNSEYRQNEVVADPAGKGIFPETNSKIRNENSGQIPQFEELQYLLSFGLSYDFEHGQSKFTISPEIGFDYSFSDAINGVYWRNSRLRAGLAISYNFAEKIKIDRKKEAEPKYENKNEKPVITNNKNFAEPEIKQDDFKIKVVGVTNSIERPVLIVSSEEFLYFDLKPLLTYVFFEENSYNIPDRYLMLNEEYSNLFDINALAKGETLEIYYNLLNIIGFRLKNNPDSEITITGCNSNTGSEKGNIELSEKRALSIKNHLVDAWNIEGERITIKINNLPAQPSNSDHLDGQEENRRAEISSDDWEIIKPLIVDDTSRSISPPTLRFYTTSFTSKENLEWTLSVEQSGKSILKKSGKGIPDKKLDVNLGDYFKFESISVDSIYYKLEVRHLNDSSAVEYSGSIPVDRKTIREKISMNKDQKKIDKYKLILFSFDKSELNIYNAKIADIINARINENSQVKIKAYTDRTGTEQYNLELSQQRADAAARAIKNKSPEKIGLGSSILLFDNDFPEGRFYCRTVEIIVESEIKSGEKK